MQTIKDSTYDERMILLLQKSLRYGLCSEETKTLSKLYDGLSGEKLFSSIAKEKIDHGLGFFDLRFEILGKEFQLDSLVIMNDSLYVFEIKWSNYDVTCIDNKYYFADSSDEIININQQRSRTWTLFSKFLETHRLNYDFSYYHVFINPERKLYSNHINNHCLHIHDLTRFFSEHSEVPNFHDHSQLTQTLINEHRPTSKYEQPITIPKDNIKKGVICDCGKCFIAKCTNRRFTCTCEKIYSSSDVIDNALNEYKLIYQKNIFTVTDIYDWCNALISKRTIRRFLLQNNKKQSNYKSTYYS